MTLIHHSVAILTRAIHVYPGRELYPRIGKHFDIKTWTNCRMGMMAWAILPLCYAVKQLQATGSISNSMLISEGLLEAYVFKFFLYAQIPNHHIMLYHNCCLHPFAWNSLLLKS